jgi:pimeloyl-ACP methyl ester carboxylesterase
MSTYTATTVPTQFVEANAIRFAYRRWGKRSGLPLVFNQHFTGNLDNWDPAVLDGLAKEREVIIFNNAGVASSSGEVPTIRSLRRKLQLLGNGPHILESAFACLENIKQPTLVVSGNHDVIVYTVNSLYLVQNMPNAKLILYPDANHGSWYENHQDFVFETNRFLNESDRITTVRTGAADD